MTEEASASERLARSGYALPAAWVLPSDVEVKASFVRVVGRRVAISGHLPLDGKGKVVGPFGKVGAEVSLGEARVAGERAMLGILASLQRELGSLDRIGAWLRVFGMVNAAAGFLDFPAVVNGASQVLLDVFGPVAGVHARVAVGVSGLPFDAPVEIEAEAELRAEA